MSKLKSMPYAQADVRTLITGETILRSYATDVAYITSDGWLFVNGLYSATTRKHLGAFAKEYCGCYYDTLKKCYNEQLTYNINTKEFVSLATGEAMEG